MLLCLVDSPVRFFVQVVPVIGPIVMVFCQDPLVSAETVDAFLEHLRRAHAVDARIQLKKIRYPADYKPGDLGEFSFNHAGAEPTVEHSKNKWESQVPAKPYPPPGTAPPSASLT